MRRRTFAHRGAVAAGAVALGALVASLAEDSLAAPRPAPGPLARDEEFVVRFAGAAPLRRVREGAIALTSEPGSELPDPAGEWLLGTSLIDRGAHRPVVVRPEALREFFVLVKGLPREDADAQAAKLLDRIERSGKTDALARIDEALNDLLRASASGTRLDDAAVSAVYPPTGTPGDFRRMIAGDDFLHAAYLAGDFNAFATLAADPTAERFFHPVDPATGVADAQSVLRSRQHRRALMQRAPGLLTFVPRLPVAPDLSDAGFAAGATVRVRLADTVIRKVKDLLPARGGTLRFPGGLGTLTTTPDDGDGGVFLGGTPWTGSPAAGRPRVVNVTPPNGEFNIDVTTDWEDPDNVFTTPLPSRRKFVFRLRFDAPLDPRTVDRAHFTVTKLPGIAVPASVTLVQSRMGEVRVEIRPDTLLDPAAGYEVQALGTVRGLNGVEMGAAFVTGVSVP